MNSYPPLISIGLPVYNGENFVADAINCVLSQTITDWELIIADNASTDRTLDIVREFARKDQRIKINEGRRNMGVSLNYNRVFELSQGRFFKWIAHDDLFSPDFLEACVGALEQDEGIVLAFPKIVHVDSSGRTLREQVVDLSVLDDSPDCRVARLMRLEVLSTDIFWAQFGLIRRKILAETSLMGLYNGSDQVLLLELVIRGKCKQVDRGMFLRREHPLASTLRSGWTMTERAKFVYADDRRRLVFPYCRMLKEHLACLGNTRMPLWLKIGCAGAVLRRFSAQWKYFAHEFVESPMELLNS